MDNRDYFRDMVEYAVQSRSVKAIKFSVQNEGRVVVRNVFVSLRFTSDDPVFMLYGKDNDEAPKRPSTILIGSVHSVNYSQPDTVVERGAGWWNVNVTVDVVQPQRTVLTRGIILVGAAKEITVEGSAIIYGENIPEPLGQKLTLRIRPKDEELPWKQILAIAKELE
jgi:hypothetical protein